MLYKMIIQTSTGGLQWEYNFDIANDAMASEYAMRHTKQFACVPWFMSMTLFKATDNNDWTFMVEYGIEKPAVLPIVRKR